MPRPASASLGGDRAYADADELLEVAEGNGPVDALYRALLKALTPRFPSLSRVQLLDYKVRILDPELATEATTRVLISFSLPAEGVDQAGAADAPPTKAAWSTVAADTNVISASVSALCDGLEFALIGLLGFECDDDECDVTATVHEAVERATRARARARARARVEPRRGRRGRYHEGSRCREDDRTTWLHTLMSLISPACVRGVDDHGAYSRCRNEARAKKRDPRA